MWKFIFCIPQINPKNFISGLVYEKLNKQDLQY